MNVRLPSWFWLLLCLASFGGSVLAWSVERPVKARPVAAPAAVATNLEPDESTSNALPSAAAQAPPVAPTAPTRPVLTVALPSDTGTAPRVLRCDVRGRVTYIDIASACPDGSQGKVTLLPR